MTGFGRRQAPWQDGSVTVEMRSVNHRFLEIACRLPRPLSHLEDSFKKAIQRCCTRGRIDTTVTVQAGKGRAGSVNLDQALAKQYHRALCTLKKSLKLSGSIDLALMAGLRDVVSISDQPTEDPKLAKIVQQLGRPWQRICARGFRRSVGTKRSSPHEPLCWRRRSSTE
jgi:uncharacterized protein (TIGR00255 family)